MSDPKASGETRVSGWDCFIRGLTSPARRNEKSDPTAQSIGFRRASQILRIPGLTENNQG